MKVDTVGPGPAATGPKPSTSEATGKFGLIVEDLDRGEKFVDRVIAKAMRGRDFSPSELIAIQAGVYRHAQNMEAFGILLSIL